MRDSDERQAAFTAKIKSLPIVRQLIERNEFVAVAAVELLMWTEIDAASAFALSGQMSRRTRRKQNIDDDRIWWEFESEEDAILFHVKFGGVARTPEAMVESLRWKGGFFDDDDA